MKKIIILSIATVMVISTFLLTGSSIKTSIPRLKAYSIQPTTVEDTVVCTGKVEYKQNKEIKSEINGTISDIYFSKNDTVCKGDVLCTVKTSSQQQSPITAASEEDIINAIKSGDYSAVSEYAQQGKIQSNAADNTDIPKEIDIVSPIDGVILDIDKGENSFVTIADTIMKVVSADNLCVVLPVNESKVSDIAIGQAAVITGNGFKNNEYYGTVSYIDNVAQQVSTVTGKETAVEVHVDVDSPKEDIKDGYSAKCVITTAESYDKLIVPYEAILSDDNQQEYVYLYDSGIAKKQYVNIGKEYENGVEVLLGISSNDIVLENSNMTRSGEVIKISECVVNVND
ncbi:MAG TPA: HlyD family efflux transporter periplasmic adaptor subunit [Clostridiales bacterium]|nr:HlyD family efflux transporter periplasmic adaptor subunit [Clostridiales bacterium]